MFLLLLSYSLVFDHFEIFIFYGYFLLLFFWGVFFLKIFAMILKQPHLLHPPKTEFIGLWVIFCKATLQKAAESVIDRPYKLRNALSTPEREMFDGVISKSFYPKFLLGVMKNGTHVFGGDQKMQMCGNFEGFPQK